MNDKEKKILLMVRDGLMSDGSDTGDACMRVHYRMLTEMLGLDYTKAALLMERPPFEPLYFPENYASEHPR